MKQLSLSAILFIGLSSGAASSTLNRSITVSGTCSRQVTPDRGSITITAEAQEMDLQAAAKKATEIQEKVKEAIQKLRLENFNLTTSEYTLIEVKEWQKDKTVFKGFKARMGFRVSTSSIQRLGEVIAIAAKNGVRDVGALNTFLSQEKLLKEQSGCLEEAGANATLRAAKLAASLDARLGEILQISEFQPTSQDNPVALHMMRKSNENMDAGGIAAPSVEGGSQALSVTIYATFALK